MKGERKRDRQTETKTDGHTESERETDDNKPGVEQINNVRYCMNGARGIDNF